MVEPPPDYLQQEAAQQEAEQLSQQVSAMETQELQQAEMLGEIPPYVVQELEQQAEQGLTPQEMTTIEQEELTIESLPPAEAQQYEQTIIAEEQQTSSYEEQVGLQEANQFDQTIREAGDG